MIPITGPNDSSVMTRIEWSTPTNTVGPRYGDPGVEASKSDSDTNATAPAAVGMRSLLSNVIQTAIIGAFTQALPDRLPASPGSGLSILNVKTSARGGRTIMASIGPVGGGAGGGPYADGAEGSGANMSFLKNTPVEINEAEVPIRILKYGLVPNSGGAGLYRGGSGAMMEFQLFAPHSMVTARNRDRTIFSAWGVLGGGPGATSRFIKNPDSPNPVSLGNSDIVMCDPGDVILVEGPGAGGYGNPLERSAELVLVDTRCGFVSRDSAKTDYGVVIHDDGTLDEAGTAELRHKMIRTRTTAHYSHGGGRLQFERVWTLNRYDAMTSILSKVPITWRYFVKHKLFAALAGNIAPPDGGAQDVHARYAELAQEFSELPGPATIAARDTAQMAKSAAA